MNKIVSVLIFTFFLNVQAQDIPEQKITSEISEVTVFIKNAQVSRKKSIQIKKGINILKFINLSPFIDANSIQAKSDNETLILSVNHQQNYLEKIKKENTLSDLETQLEAIEDKITLEETLLDILKEELEFLKENRNIGGKNEVLSITNLKDASNFYGSRLTTLKIKEIEHNKKIKSLSKTKANLKLQINTLTSKKDYPNGEILVKIEARSSTIVNLELSYIVGNTGWYPTYDIRAKNINTPIDLIYKANIKQDTKVNWKDVKLSLSTANPNVSGLAPELKIYYLGYNIAPPTYNKNPNQISASVLDESGLPLPGVSIVVKGTSIGTLTDFDGKFSLTIPDSNSEIEFSYLGMKTITTLANIVPNKVIMEEDSAVLDEVVLIGYSEKKSRRTSKKGAPGLGNEVQTRATKPTIPLNQKNNQTTINFEIKKPYTVKSDNKNYTVDIVSYNLPASYNYYSVPKINPDAFLMANISNWEKYNLLEGEANIFFEDTYVGKTLLDTRYTLDTLQISLGRDKNVSVKREKIKDFTTKQFIGNKKEETRAWNITIKNNKQEKINMFISDQIPVSILQEIIVEAKETSMANYDEASGIMKWEFNLNPNETKTINLKYLVKYPKAKNSAIE